MTENTSSLSNTQKLVAELKNKTWVDLTHSFGPDSPRFPSFKPAKFETIFTHSDGFFVKEYTFPGQYGTHIDPPIHFYKDDDRYVEDLKLKDLVLPLVVIDRHEAAAKNPDSSLTVKDIKDWEKKHGPIPTGSFVALRTDWGGTLAISREV